MKSEVIGDELQRAVDASEGMRVKELVPANIEAEIDELEFMYQSNPSLDTKTQLLARYILLSRWLPVDNSGIVIKVRARFQEQFPEHFKAFMENLKASGTSARWAGCLPCKHNLGHGCAKGLQPQRLPSRYLNRDYTCSAFEAKIE